MRIATKSGRGVTGPKFPTVAGFPTTIDCTSGSMNKISGVPAKEAFSPMLIGPIQYKEDPEAKLFENFWQYGKVFQELGHTRNGHTTDKWRLWRDAGYKGTTGGQTSKGHQD